MILSKNRMLPMKRLHSTFVFTGVVLLFCAGPSAVRLQAQLPATPERQKILLSANLKPGDVLRYELEAAGSFLPIADASGAILSPPRGPCDYALAASVTLADSSMAMRSRQPARVRANPFSTSISPVTNGRSRSLIAIRCLS